MRTKETTWVRVCRCHQDN